jgi:multiple sugar transport system substrate-binding protein
MISRFFIPLLVILLLTNLAAGCGQDASEDLHIIGQQGKPISASPEGDKASDQIKLTLWSYFDGWQSTIEAFQQKYPNKDISVEVKTYTFSEYTKIYLDALLSGTVPDIMVMDSAHLGNFNSISGLQDLLAPPYDAGKYKDQFPASLWNNHLNIDGEHLYAWPLSISPMVTYYRADIMESYGFPHEPAEFGEFIQDEKQFIRLAERLNEDGKWVFQWNNDPIYLHAASEGLFNRNLEYLRETNEFQEALDVSKRIKALELDLKKSMWTSEGQKAIREGDLVLVSLGAYGADQLQAWAPETDGLWRAAQLPFGLHGLSGYSSFALPEAGLPKEWAWKFIEFAVTEHSLKGFTSAIPAYIPARKNPKDLERRNAFLGGQQAYKLYDKLLEGIEEFPVITPINEAAESHWYTEMFKAIDTNTDPAEEVKQAEESVLETFKREIEIIKKLSKDAGG